MWVRNLQDNDSVIVIAFHDDYHGRAILDASFNSISYAVSYSNQNISYRQEDNKHIYTFLPLDVTIMLWTAEYRAALGPGQSKCGRIIDMRDTKRGVSRLDISFFLDSPNNNQFYPLLKQILDNAYTKQVKQVGRELIGTKELVNTGTLNRNASSIVGSFLTGVNKKSLKQQITAQKGKLARKTRKARKN